MRKSLLPRWVVALVAVCAIILIPWTIGLVIVLPSRHISRHWDVAWGGFDAMMICALGLTALFAWRRSGWVMLSAMASATLLFTDAWFDTTTAGSRLQYLIALVTAICIEVPLGLLCLWVAIHTGRRAFALMRSAAEQTPSVPREVEHT